MRRPNVVLFDWDGTLYDSVKLCFEIYQELFRRFRVGELTYEAFRREFSGDYHRYQEKHGLGPKMWPKVDAAWYKIYFKRQGEAKPFSNTLGTLKRLDELSIPVGLVTNATKSRLKGELKSLGIGGYFKVVVAIEDADWEFKPQPKMIEIACEKLKADKKHALYVGDMVEDILAGKRAGVMTGAVGTGVHTIEKLAREEPDFIFADIGEVPGVFA
ncbi:MAG: HAD family hydrolase [Candidatus Micrarchaeota archaeon]